MIEQFEIPQVMSMFVPGAGPVKMLYTALRWVVDNQQALGDVFSKITNGLNALATGNVPGFKASVKTALIAGIEPMIKLAAKQFGLDKIPTAIKKVTNYIPHTVDELLRKMVKGFLSKVGSTTTGKASSGRLTEKDAEFKYKTKDFELTVVEGGAAKGTATGKASVTQLRIVHKSEGNKVHVFEAADFNAGPEKDKFDAVMLAANNLQKAAVAKDRVATTKSAKAPAKVAPKPKGVFNNLLQLQQTLTTALTALKTHLQDLGCKYLNAGCFAAGTKLWTPGGYRKIETLVPGESVYSRDEWNPSGAVEATPFPSLASTQKATRWFAPRPDHFAVGEIIPVALWLYSLVLSSVSLTVPSTQFSIVLVVRPSSAGGS